MIGRSLIAICGASLFLTACRSSEPAIYTIGIQSGPVLSGGAKVIELRGVGLAGYLDRPHIVRSSDGYRLAITSNDAWGEPLGSMVDRVLAIELAQRLPACNVYTRGSAVSMAPDAEVEVNIQRMDVGQDGQLVLLAQVAVRAGRRKQPTARTFTITKPVVEPGTAGEVAAISAAIGDLADDIAQMLRA